MRSQNIPSHAMAKTRNSMPPASAPYAEHTIAASKHETVMTNLLSAFIKHPVDIVAVD